MNIDNEELLAVFGPMVADIEPRGTDPEYITIDIRITRGLNRPGMDAAEPMDVRRVRFGIYGREDLHRPSKGAGPWMMLNVDGQALLKVKEPE